MTALRYRRLLRAGLLATTWLAAPQLAHAADNTLIEGNNGNDTIYAGTGGDTLLGGNGNDTFHIDSHTGNDTVDGGGGTNTIDFDNRSSKDIASLHTSGGQTVIHFTDGQVVNVSHVENLVFTNTTEHLH